MLSTFVHFIYCTIKKQATTSRHLRTHARAESTTNYLKRGHKRRDEHELQQLAINRLLHSRATEGSSPRSLDVVAERTVHYPRDHRTKT